MNPEDTFTVNVLKESRVLCYECGLHTLNCNCDGCACTACAKQDCKCREGEATLTRCNSCSANDMNCNCTECGCEYCELNNCVCLHTGDDIDDDGDEDLKLIANDIPNLGALFRSARQSGLITATVGYH